VLQGVRGACPHHGPEGGPGPLRDGGQLAEHGGKELRTMTADDCYDVLERAAWLALAEIALEVEHYEA
jgi:hypothetical protein